jgi:hypothetical protein
MILFRLLSFRTSIYALFGALMLSTLWVTSLSLLSAKQNATELLSDAGAQVLNPFLVGQNLGLSQSVYASMEAAAKQHPSQPVPLPSVFKTQVTGSKIVGKSYPDVVQIVYAQVAGDYYDGGVNAVFQVPAELQQVIPSFGLFNASPNDIPVVPGGPAPSQLPTFLQPFFTFIGLTPATFTAGGHQSLLSLLPWFWIATVVLGGLLLLLNRSEKRLNGLAHSVVHSSWPIVVVLVGLWIASLFYAATFAPYTGVLGVVSRAFLPVYGAALVVGLLTLLLIRLVPVLRQRAQGQAGQSKAPVPAGIPAGMGNSGMGNSGMGSGGFSAPPPSQPPSFMEPGSDTSPFSAPSFGGSSVGASPSDDNSGVPGAGGPLDQQ